MALSVPFEAGQASGQSSQTEDNIGMEPKYYNAAAKGEIEVFKGFKEPLNQLLTPNRNTVLHIYLSSPKESESKDLKSKYSKSKDPKPENSESSTAFVQQILGMCRPLLRQANVKGETPLHIAARYGHAAIVDVLIKCASERAPQEDPENGVNYAVQKMLEKINNEKDTALHEAVRGDHLKVVKRLIEEGEDFSYSQNDAGETPLYIAVERNYEKVASHILRTCTSLAHDGPLGRTTLHAAVIVNNRDMIQRILGKIAQEEQSIFIKKVDKHCWTPLHCAAYFNHDVSAKMLLEVDRSIAYVKDAKGVTALHIAAHRGHRRIMECILEYCPDCCELVDERGWNALHFVVNSSSSIWAESGAETILRKSSLSNLLNEKDARGNTPLHHHSKSLHYIKDVVHHNRVDKMAFNKQNLNAYDAALTSEELSDKKFMQITLAFIDECRPAEVRIPLEDDILSKRKDYEGVVDKDLDDMIERYEARLKARKAQFVFIMEKASQVHLVVDTLIATVAFTAGITMPGGFIGHEGAHPGSAVLTRNTAFKAFIITNTVAMLQSCSAAFIQLFIPLLFHDKNPGEFTFVLALLAFCLSISAMGAMLLAFVLGTYAVLMQSLGLAIANSVIGLFFFILVFFVTVGCSRSLREVWTMGSSRIFDSLSDFLNFFYQLYCRCLRGPQSGLTDSD